MKKIRKWLESKKKLTTYLYAYRKVRLGILISDLLSLYLKCPFFSMDSKIAAMVVRTFWNARLSFDPTKNSL